MYGALVYQEAISAAKTWVFPVSPYNNGDIRIVPVWDSGGSAVTWAVSTSIARVKEAGKDPLPAYMWDAISPAPSTASAGTKDSDIVTGPIGSIKITATPTGTATVSVFIGPNPL